MTTLDFLPLAITQAAAYISENEAAVADHLNLVWGSNSDMNDLLKEDLSHLGSDPEFGNCLSIHGRYLSDPKRAR